MNRWNTLGCNMKWTRAIATLFCEADGFSDDWINVYDLDPVLLTAWQQAHIAWQQVDAAKEHYRFMQQKARSNFDRFTSIIGVCDG